MQMGNASSGETEVKLFEKNLNVHFSETEAAHVHIALC